MVTITSAKSIGSGVILLEYSSNQADPTFYIYLNGEPTAETKGTNYELPIGSAVTPIIEILDDENAIAMQVHPATIRLGWYHISGSDYYRIDEWLDSQWVQQAQIPEQGGYLSWESAKLADGLQHKFRIVPVDTAGNEGTAREFIILMVRHPDDPNVDYSYNESTKKIIISE